MANFSALIDANVLYSAARTDIIIECARAGIFRTRWTEDIHTEWMRNLASNRSDLDPVKLQRRRELMDAALPDVLVTGYADIAKALTGINEKDRHVLAAAIKGGCSVIVTENLKDFPENVLTPYDIEAQHPDTFLIYQMGLNENRFVGAVKAVRARMKKPAYTTDEYIERLRKSNLPLLADELRKNRFLL